MKKMQKVLSNEENAETSQQWRKCRSFSAMKKKRKILSNEENADMIQQWMKCRRGWSYSWMHSVNEYIGMPWISMINKYMLNYMKALFVVL